MSSDDIKQLIEQQVNLMVHKFVFYTLWMILIFSFGFGVGKLL
jgi:hypothetical protein